MQNPAFRVENVTYSLSKKGVIVKLGRIYLYSLLFCMLKYFLCLLRHKKCFQTTRMC